MSDGQIGTSHVAIPDLTEPVVGFRNFKLYPKQDATEDHFVDQWSGPSPDDNPFRPPNEYVTDPVSGKMIPNYRAIADAQDKWRESLGVKKKVLVKGSPALPARLVSPHKSEHVWHKGVHEAVCKKSLLSLTNYEAYTLPGHTSPHSDCQCGYYSYYNMARTYQHLSTHTAVGIVTQWGQIEAHETGMRSQFMKVEALMGYRDEGKELAEDWGIPYFAYTPAGPTVQSVLEPLATEFGSPLPESMRPKASPPSLSRGDAALHSKSTQYLKRIWVGGWCSFVVLDWAWAFGLFNVSL